METCTSQKQACISTAARTDKTRICRSPCNPARLSPSLVENGENQPVRYALEDEACTWTDMALSPLVIVLCDPCVSTTRALPSMEENGVPFAQLPDLGVIYALVPTPRTAVMAEERFDRVSVGHYD